jgi:predicted AlkP superfamily phosphohydrolase/phosphomutase
VSQSGLGRGTGPLVAVAWDAAEPSLVEAWMADGSLPNLRQLRDQGGYGRLRSSAGMLAGSPWPTFYSGTSPEVHGIYHYLQWSPEPAALLRPGPDWLPVRPFWQDLSDAGRRVLIIDVPMAPPPQPLAGVEISGWSSHDRLAPPASYPEDVMRCVIDEFGDCPLGDEIFGCTSARSVLGIRDEVKESTRRLADLVTAWLTRGDWEFVLVAFGAPHRGGHRLWDLSGVRDSTVAGREKALSHAMKEVYTACDEALGRIRAAAPEHARIVVFSLHGMGPNTSRVGILPEMLARILGENTQPPSSVRIGRVTQSLVERVPVEWRHAAKKQLPRAIKDWLTEKWYMGASDVSSQRAFSLVADLQGYIRINLRGRERNGLVELGEELDALCDRIQAGLRSFVDADTREPIVHDVVRVEQVCAPAERLQLLPDLVVRWTETSAARHRAVVSPDFGVVPWPVPSKQPDGRSGNHRDEGFVAGLGKTEPQAHILDLAPTFLSCLAVRPPEIMAGRSLVSSSADER